MIFTARSLRPSPSARGMVTAMVVMMFVFIAAAIMALTLLFATEAHRTRSVTSGTQLRQLLLAAAPSAAEELRRHGSAARDVAVPTPLENDQAQVRAVAKIAGAANVQTLIFVHVGGEWRLQSAILSGQP